ncbi:hypothetical protein LTR08_000801 [Meristemomyces frigidus]|nr:hypothetical protein LTR08_000801 [Meristemomyces frigidus]
MAQPPPPPQQSRDNAFDIVSTYNALLHADPDLTMPVAAIEALILALAHTPSTTVSETLALVSTLTARLKTHTRNPISLSAGTDLFQQYLITNLQRPSSSSDFDTIRAHLVQNGRLFVSRAKAARATIAAFGRHFIRDGTTVLTTGGSRVVGALLRSAAEAAGDSSSIRFRVIYVVFPTSPPTPSPSPSASESSANITALRRLNIPVATIPPEAIAYSLSAVTQCFVGAEGVVENGGVVSRLGTLQMAMLAKAAGKPFYVVAESHKFVRLYPLGQGDLGVEQGIVAFRTAEGGGEEEAEEGGREGEGLDGRREASDEGVADMDGAAADKAKGGAALAPPWRLEDAVDYTPPHLISGIITESGVLLPSAVSEELIKIWF